MRGEAEGRRSSIAGGGNTASATQPIGSVECRNGGETGGAADSFEGKTAAWVERRDGAVAGAGARSSRGTYTARTGTRVVGRGGRDGILPAAGAFARRHVRGPGRRSVRRKFGVRRRAPIPVWTCNRRR